MNEYDWEERNRSDDWNGGWIDRLGLEQMRGGMGWNRREENRRGRERKGRME
jgi:hypothetical protein